LDGAVIETDDSYYPGTLMRVGLDAPATADMRDPTASFALWVRIVRKVPTGICVAFVFQDERELEDFHGFLALLEGRGEREPVCLQRTVLNESPSSG